MSERSSFRAALLPRAKSALVRAAAFTGVANVFRPLTRKVAVVFMLLSVGCFWMAHFKRGVVLASRPEDRS